MDVDGLPDDVVAKIFSLLPPLMLVDSIPLVCKRWQQLARHPDSWRYFNLYIPLSPTKQQMIDLSRFAKVAPYLNGIDFSDVLELTPAVTSLVKLLLVDQKTIKTIRTFRTSTKRMRAFTEKMLERFSVSLREVHFTLASPNSVTEEFYTSINCLLTLASEIPQLLTLSFNFIDVEDFQNYSGQLGKGCPSLKKFVLVGALFFEGEWDKIIFDVLESKKDQLQDIDIEFLCEPMEKFVEAIRNCHNVETLRIPMGLLAVASHMSRLQSLHLCFNEDYDCMLTQDILKYVKDSPSIGKIKKLGVCCLSDELRVMYTKASKCLEAISKRSKDIQVFCVLNVANLNVLSMFLSKMNLLHTLIIHNSWASRKPFGTILDVNSKISNLSYLKYLKLTDLKFRMRSEKDAFDITVHLLKEMQPRLVVTYNSEVVNVSDSDSGSELSSLSYDYDEQEFTYFDYLRNRYGEDLSDSELYALMSSDDD
ncbi:F-box/LRR-repeat protein 7 [Frankliniella fusca]|uniref:F-box/LRR-repeat protein 7 n=1 Tax=Frankliniella fusca TaxID=407009 RepID=A0AAE1LRF8_9NEOP|nr:F-box/LRR-repeat protein 7 [Frankliniella fusca]